MLAVKNCQEFPGPPGAGNTCVGVTAIRAAGAQAGER
jgi:hypothetical protein